LGVGRTGVQGRSQKRGLKRKGLGREEAEWVGLNKQIERITKRTQIISGYLVVQTPDTRGEITVTAGGAVGG